jgi:hypothetical protein
LWLGPRFHGFRLRAVASGVYRPKLAGPTRRPVRFVRFYYGSGIGQAYALSIEELGPSRPWFDKQGPRPGSIELLGSTRARLSRGGVLVRIATDPRRFRLVNGNAVELAKALRPVG